MPVTRREFLKFGAAAGAAALLSSVVSGNNKQTVKPNTVPGSGEPGHFDKGTLDLIDTAAFLGACSRCGVCIGECPFKAIKSTGWQLPLLTSETRHKCPGIDVCGVCLAVCPTSALSQAYKPLEDVGITARVGKDPWWQGKSINTDFLKKPQIEGGE
jgi:ferredoxin